MNPVWQEIATFLIRWRIPFLILLTVLISFMWINRGTEISHELTQVLPLDDQELSSYLDFKKEFGEDGNVLVIGIEEAFSKLEIFNGIYDLVEGLKTAEGVENVVGITHLFDIVSNEEKESFEVTRINADKPESQEELDKIMDKIESLSFYQGLLIDKESKTTLLAVSIIDTFLNTERKTEVYDNIMVHTQKFEEKFDTELKYAGLPVIRVNVHKTIKWELALFLYIALVVLAITLLWFFRSIYMVVFPMLVVGGVVVCTLGLIGLFGYKITLVTGVIPALITVITIPNCVYLITKYHIEYRRTNNKMKSLVMVIQKIGIVTIMTNTTTAVGLGVLALTGVQALKEFGVIAGLSVVAAFFISLILIPIVFSFLPPPTPRQTKHLDRKSLSFIINWLDNIVQNHRWAVYAFSIALAVVSLYGTYKVQSIAYIVDDIPQDSKVMRDMKFIEERFNGALPFEILIDTKRKRGVQRLSNLKRINELQNRLKKYDELSRTISITDLTKYLRQAFYGGNPEGYDIPSRPELDFIKSYLLNTELSPGAISQAVLTDSLMQKTRISASVMDIGSLKMSVLMDSVKKDIEEVFGKSAEVNITGTTQIFIRGNEYLVNNLLSSLVIAFMVIAVLMGVLFKSKRMVVISLVPNFLPLIMVAGIMGYFGIPLKPSTALVFGVAFGIAVDDSIHFLARYRLARASGDTIAEAISNSYQDTGVSMIYTSVILFFGFVTFTASSFGGTKSLGLLTSMTLSIAMFSNLILLPALLLSFDKEKRVTKKEIYPLSPIDGEGISSNGNLEEELEESLSQEVADSPAETDPVEEGKS